MGCSIVHMYAYKQPNGFCLIVHKRNSETVSITYTILVLKCVVHIISSRALFPTIHLITLMA